MTPERIAELRRHTPYCVDHHYESVGCETNCFASNNKEMLVEIERLRGLVADAHCLVLEADNEPTFYGLTPSAMLAAWCRGCLWNHAQVPGSDPEWELDEFFTTEAEARAAHAAHVAEILNGGAKWPPNESQNCDGMQMGAASSTTGLPSHASRNVAPKATPNSSTRSSGVPFPRS